MGWIVLRQCGHVPENGEWEALKEALLDYGTTQLGCAAITPLCRGAALTVHSIVLPLKVNHSELPHRRGECTMVKKNWQGR